MMNFMCRRLLSAGASSLSAKPPVINVFRLFRTDLRPACNKQVENVKETSEEKQVDFFKRIYYLPPEPKGVFGAVRNYLWKIFVGIDRRKELAYLLFSSIDGIKYEDFFSYLDMPDTFNSWFVITELHVWMLLTQLMDDERAGYLIRKDVVALLWNDVETRVRTLENVRMKIVIKQLRELSDRFPVALCMYDEGLLNNDMLLANALWYKFFDCHCNDPRKLEMLVKYIRHQIKYMSGICLKNYEEVKQIREKLWLPFSDYKIE